MLLCGGCLQRLFCNHEPACRIHRGTSLAIPCSVLSTTSLSFACEIMSIRDSQINTSHRQRTHCAESHRADSFAKINTSPGKALSLSMIFIAINRPVENQHLDWSWYPVVSHHDLARN